MNAYDRWLEAPYQDAYAAEEAEEENMELVRESLAHKLAVNDKFATEFFDEVAGYRTDEAALKLTRAVYANDAAAVLAIMAEMYEAAFEREAECIAIKESA